MKKMFFSIVMAVFLMTGPSAFAGSGHYISGVEGIKAASLPPEGFYWRMYNVFYTADDLRDNNKEKVEGDFDVNVYALVNRFIYSSGVKILGANLVADICIPLVYTDISMKAGGSTLFDENKFGLGDILIEPAVLAWHGPRWDTALGVGVYLPTGSFDGNDPASPGKGFWTGMFTAGATFYFDEARTWSSSALFRYEIHSEQDDTDTTYGDDFHFEWGVGKTLNKNWEIGMAGYCRWQVTDDKGPRATTDREQAYAIGPELNAFIPGWGLTLSLRSLWEFENKENSQGNITTLAFTKAF